MFGKIITGGCVPEIITSYIKILSLKKVTFTPFRDEKRKIMIYLNASETKRGLSYIKYDLRSDDMSELSPPCRQGRSNGVY